MDLNLNTFCSFPTNQTHLWYNKERDKLGKHKFVSFQEETQVDTYHELFSETGQRSALSNLLSCASEIVCLGIAAIPSQDSYLKVGTVNILLHVWME